MRRKSSVIAALGLVAALTSGAAPATAADTRATTAAAVVAAARPAVPDASFVVVRETHEVYRIVGGAPVYVTSWDAFGGPQLVTPITAAQLNAMPLTPADGTVVVGAQRGRGEVYRFAGGAPIYVSHWDNVSGPLAATPVDIAAIDNAGRPGIWSHVRATPADGTFVVGGALWGFVYRFAGGAPVYVAG
jgi:hypothetical protein